MSVSIQHISKQYKSPKVEALKDVSFDVGAGELFGLIGPDGAGKSTLFRILTTLLLPDAGRATVAGYDIHKDLIKIRSAVGYMPGRFSLYQDLSVEENLRFFATLFGTSIAENYDLIKDIYEQIEPFKHRRAGQLSGGMKQKLALSCALVHRPKVLFLDEPTTGVDAVSRKEFWQMLKKLQGEGISILVSTPYMDEAALCDRIALIQEGSLLDIDQPQGLCNKYPRPLYAIRGAQMQALLEALQADGALASAHAFGDYHHISFASADIDPQSWLAGLKERGFLDLDFKEQAPGIEDCFIELMPSGNAWSSN